MRGREEDTDGICNEGQALRPESDWDVQGELNVEC